MNRLMLVLILAAILLLLIIWIVYFVRKMKSQPRHEGETVFQSFRRTFSREESVPNNGELQQRRSGDMETLQITSQLPREASVSNLSNAPPSYASVRLSTSNFQDPEPEPPSYEDVIKPT